MSQIRVDPHDVPDPCGSPQCPRSLWIPMMSQISVDPCNVPDPCGSLRCLRSLCSRRSTCFPGRRSLSQGNVAHIQSSCLAPRGGECLIQQLCAAEICPVQWRCEPGPILSLLFFALGQQTLLHPPWAQGFASRSPPARVLCSGSLQS